MFRTTPLSRLALICGLALAVLASGMAFSSAGQADDVKPRTDDTKKEEPAKPDPEQVRKRIDELMKQLDKLHQEMRKEMAEMRRQLPQPRTVVPREIRLYPPQGRLGVLVDVPGPALVEQLGLEKGQGLLVLDVSKDSAADKVGIKRYDIIVELAGQAVTMDQNDFRRVIAEHKANTPADVVVIRKGKKETLVGLSLPEVVTRPPRP
jgi:S1-C subfamily serine protease